MAKKKKVALQPQPSSVQTQSKGPMCEVYMDVLIEQDKAGIGIACENKEFAQIGARLCAMTRKSALYIGVLFAMRTPTARNKVKVVSSVGNCAEIVSGAKTASKPNNTENENRFLNSCAICAHTMKSRGIEVQMEQYTTKKLVATMKLARLQASEALRKMTLDVALTGTLNCSQFFNDPNTSIYCFAGKFFEPGASSSKDTQLCTKKEKNVSSKAREEVESSAPVPSTTHDSMPGVLPKDIPGDTGILLLCSRCSSLVYVFCLGSHPFIQNILCKHETRYVMVLTTCRQCIYAMIESSSTKPSPQEVMGYLQECFDHIHLSGSYICTSRSFQVVQGLGMVPCALHSEDGIVKYMNVLDLSSECDFECHSCDIDLEAGVLLPYSSLGFL